MKIRDLTADDVEIRAQQVKQNGCILLIYKNARCDMNILDESVGAMNWKREHTRDNQNCIVSLWDSEKKQWVSKEDTGTESNTEKEKGQASDSFKRACFNWGIGRELYTSPFIWVNLNQDETNGKNGKFYLKSKIKFHVSNICVENKKIVGLEIKDQSGKVRFNYGKIKAKPTIEKVKSEIWNYILSLGLCENMCKKVYGSLEFEKYLLEDKISDEYQMHISAYIDEYNIQLTQMIMEKGGEPRPEGFKNQIEENIYLLNQFKELNKKEK